jgi:hypothetical protein
VCGDGDNSSRRIQFSESLRYREPCCGIVPRSDESRSYDKLGVLFFDLEVSDDLPLLEPSWKYTTISHAGLSIE